MNLLPKHILAAKGIKYSKFSFFYTVSVMILALFFLNIFSNLNLAHTGPGTPQTDENGCHHDSQGRRHCHVS